MSLRLAIAVIAIVCFSNDFVPHALAAPVEFHVLAQPFIQLGGDGAIFNGASLEAVYRLDTSVLSPTSSGSGANQGSTRWPNAGTEISLKITGSASIDGVYPAIAQFDDWAFEYIADRSLIDLPTSQFNVGGFAISLVTGIELPHNFFAGGPVPIHPKSFNTADVQAVDFSITSNTFRFIGANKTAFATAVPEPASFLVAIGGITFVAAIRNHFATGERGRV
jgi:hypothetical protein